MFFQATRPQRNRHSVAPTTISSATNQKLSKINSASSISKQADVRKGCSFGNKEVGKKAKQLLVDTERSQLDRERNKLLELANIEPATKKTVVNFRVQRLAPSVASLNKPKRSVDGKTSDLNDVIDDQKQPDSNIPASHRTFPDPEESTRCHEKWFTHNSTDHWMNFDRTMKNRHSSPPADISESHSHKFSSMIDTSTRMSKEKCANNTKVNICKQIKETRTTENVDFSVSRNATVFDRLIASFVLITRALSSSIFQKYSQQSLTTDQLTVIGNFKFVSAFWLNFISYQLRTWRLLADESSTTSQKNQDTCHEQVNETDQLSPRSSMNSVEGSTYCPSKQLTVTLHKRVHNHPGEHSLDQVHVRDHWLKIQSSINDNAFNHTFNSPVETHKYFKPRGNFKSCSICKSVTTVPETSKDSSGIVPDISSSFAAPISYRDPESAPSLSRHHPGCDMPCISAYLDSQKNSLSLDNAPNESYQSESETSEAFRKRLREFELYKKSYRAFVNQNVHERSAESENIYDTESSQTSSNSTSNTDYDLSYNFNEQRFRYHNKDRPEEDKFCFSSTNGVDLSTNDPGDLGENPQVDDITSIPKSSSSSILTRSKSLRKNLASFEFAKKRLGFQQKGPSCIKVQRSEEIFPPKVRHLTRQDTIQSFSNFSKDFEIQSHCNSIQRLKNSSGHFVEGLGAGQVASRQALVSPYLGDMQLSLMEDRKGRLEIEVIRARQLRLQVGGETLSHSYVKVYLLRDQNCIFKCKTAPGRLTQDPLFQKQFVFQESYTNCLLRVIVWGCTGRIRKKRLIGTIQIQLNHLDMSKLVIGWYRLFNEASLRGPQFSGGQLHQMIIEEQPQLRGFEEFSIYLPTSGDVQV